MNRFTLSHFGAPKTKRPAFYLCSLYGAMVALFLSSFCVPATAQLVRIVSGPDVASITPARDQFRIDLGGGNVAGPNGSFGGVRREINWDGVPDVRSAPNSLPPDFFNVNSPRGVVFSTPGTGFQVSANAGVAPFEFDNLNPTYSSLFATFSPQRLFTALGSNITDVRFFIPGTNTPSLTRGFGAVFTDVDISMSTTIQLFDPNDQSLGIWPVPPFPGQQTFSFVGISYAAPIISRVRITSGNAALGPGANEILPGTDLAVMDDFIYGEPLAATTWYRDFDNDGFGDPARTVMAVMQPAGYVSNNTDCNDYRVFYQDMDNDGWGNSTKVPCGTITRTGDCDDNNNRVHSPQTFYRDADGDSWGDAGNTIVVCSSVPPAGYVANKLDCNDADRAIRYCPPPPVTKTTRNGPVQEIQGTALALSAYPNPASRSTRILYTVPFAAQVSIKIVDVLGREVGSVVNGARNAGSYSAEYNTQKLSEGVYYCRMTARGEGLQAMQTLRLMKTE